MIPGIRIWHTVATVFGFVALTAVFVLLSSIAVCGCGGGPIVEHARAAQLVAPVISTARTVIHTARAADLDGCAGAPDTDLCLDEREARWAPGVAAYNLTVDTWHAWVDGIELANIAGMAEDAAREILGPLLLALLRAWDGVVESLEPFEELDLPDFPGLGLLTGGAP